MNQKLPVFILTVLITVLFFSCKQNAASEKKESGQALPVSMDDSSRAIIDRAITYAGGEEAWQNAKTVSFDKKSISYDSAGSISRELDQHFDYMMKPVFKAKINYTLNDTAIQLMHDGEKARKYYNGKMSADQKDIDGAWNSSFGSQFVMCMPFKLKDPGIKAEYMGEVKLNDGRPAQLVKTSYIEGAGSNPTHKWYYYFEPGSGKLLANSLNWKDSLWDYTSYEQFEKSGGIMLPAVRKTYTADALNHPGKLTGESHHKNIEVNKEFEADHFKIKNDK